MARIVLGSYMVRFPLGGMLSWVLQYLVGLQRLGHDVCFVEKSGYPGSCYDPERDSKGDDCSYGVKMVSDLLEGFGLGDRWCFVDAAGRYHGMSRPAVEDAFRHADAFVDMGTHGSWAEEAASAGARILIDGEPGRTQMSMELSAGEPHELTGYDSYFTTGRNIGTTRSPAPTAGRTWMPLFHPVVVDLFDQSPPPPGAPFTTVMKWRSYKPVEYRGQSFGSKDVEFETFRDLPRLVEADLELALTGSDADRQRLEAEGWRVRDGRAVTRSVQSFFDYVGTSAAEFSVAKNVFVASATGWFSDRSAVYLAQGRPVVLQDTGFGEHLPCGEGLFAVRDADEAAAAITEIAGDYDRHAKRARDIASEFLDTTKVLPDFLNRAGVV
jgi:hypothetical protein